ncbi:bifunctional Micro-fibrillar-associated protein 1 [Babesia duncani]|uniref:Bifunctional Micro-fibrillar-associated protein 1 n=1 Tax=Babesia duncani TaxID=323732 RepID=A0AAD9PPG9_9APIC|nr:bifunctional Micro-fibrillar-associated protein 1 [Babesia duncani]
MSAIELFKFLGQDTNRSTSPPKNILKKKCKKPQGERVRRYWPGKAPEHAQESESDSEYEEEETLHSDAVAAQAPVTNDRRYARYSNARDTGAAARTGRRQAIVEVVESGANETLEVPQEDPEVPHVPEDPQVPIDRNALRARALEYRKQEQAQLEPPTLEDEDEESDDESEDKRELEYPDNLNGSLAFEQKPLVMEKPHFVPKHARALVKEAMDLERRQKQSLEMERNRLKLRKQESKRLLVQQLSEANLGDKDEESPETLVDDSDDPTDQREYELWKIRELKRLLCDKEERMAHEKLMQEVERRRQMTPEELKRDNARIDAQKVKGPPRGKMRFLQKYYHKGAFFMDKREDGSEPIYNRDFNAPTADDLIDRSALPKPMQVRRGFYGKQGQVKHTHLADVDTTRFDMPWSLNAKRPKGNDGKILKNADAHFTGFERPSKKR